MSDAARVEALERAVRRDRMLASVVAGFLCVTLAIVVIRPLRTQRHVDSDGVKDLLRAIYVTRNPPPERAPGDLQATDYDLAYGRWFDAIYYDPRVDIPKSDRW